MNRILSYLLLLFLFSCKSDITNNQPEEQQKIFWEQTASINKLIGGIFIDSNDNILVSTEYGYLYRSTDKGNTWVNLNNGLLRISIVNVINSIAVNSMGYIYVATGSGQIYSSKDNGSSWFEVSGNGIRANYLIINSKDEIFAVSCCGYEGSGVYRSIDNGNSWTKPDSIIEYFSPSTMCLNSKGQLFAASTQGVFRSDDSGETWIKIKDDWITTLAIDSQDNLFIVNGYSDNKYLSVSVNDGANWDKISSTNINYIITNSKGQLFAITSNTGVSRSPDKGKTWYQIGSGLTYPLVRCLATNSKGYIFAGTGIFEKDVYGDQRNKGEVFRSKESTY